MLNRQARFLGSDHWYDFGDVAHADAAEQLALEHCNFPQKVMVITRDEDAHFIEFKHEVSIYKSAKVRSLRGDKDAE